MFSLMNVGSHWPSDFPLGFLIGYTSGRTVVARAKERERAASKPEGTQNVGWQWEGISPSCFGAKYGLQSEWIF